MGSLNGRRLDRLEGRIGIPKSEAQKEQERRKARVIAQLNALEAHIKSMAPAERAEWRNTPRSLAEVAKLAAELERRREHEPA